MAVTLTAPPAPAAQAPLTPDDLLALEAEHGASYELVNGELKERGRCRIQRMHFESEGEYPCDLARTSKALISRPARQVWSYWTVASLFRLDDPVNGYASLMRPPS